GAAHLAVERALARRQHADEGGEHDRHRDGGVQRRPPAPATAAGVRRRGGRPLDRHVCHAGGTSTAALVPAGTRRRCACGGGAPAWAGADAGSTGRRRRPGAIASTVPMATSAPPSHSHMINGCTVTPITVGSPGFCGADAMVRYTSLKNVLRTDGVPIPPPGSAW